eukprot:269951-Pyramimonas_sp.AAC.1
MPRWALQATYRLRFRPPGVGQYKVEVRLEYDTLASARRDPSCVLGSEACYTNPVDKRPSYF